MRTADDLLAVRSGRPRQTNLRRAVSSAYYALFHCLAQYGADLLIGGAGAARSNPAWVQTYRALEHGLAKNNCKNRAVVSRFPRDIQDFADLFVAMQEKRHEADYSPNARFFKSEVEKDIADTRSILQRFGAVPVSDRRAFAAFVLFKRR